MNNFKRISAVILALCTAATIFASCGNNPKNDDTLPETEVIEITEIITEKETVTVEVTDENGEVSVSVSEKIITVPVTKKVIITRNDKTENKPDAPANNSAADQTSSVADQTAAVDSTIIQSETSAPKKPVVTSANDTAAKTTTKKNEAITTAAPIITTVAPTKRAVVDDKINEKSVGIFMLSKTDPIQIGNYANIIVQGTPGKTYSIDFYETPSSTSQIEDKKADANGFVSWSFEIGSSCNLGKRKIVVKEIDSDNYIETSITVK